ncbi:MAG: thiamine-phosphate pyrophosphorylase [Candidatus Omnitrophica bacterium]|nr:thiamine-phosphate pyrophosphorylase [Candidatus Omnitrophota bacterium]
MRKRDDKQLDRVIDANFNRAKEGLRVCEDVCRFVLDAENLTRGYKTVRHRLTEVVSGFTGLEMILSRGIEMDVGRKSAPAELKRKSIKDIFYANSQRAKESIRVLEEFAKLRDKKHAEGLKRLRYKVYALEKDVIERC